MGKVEMNVLTTGEPLQGIDNKSGLGRTAARILPLDISVRQIHCYGRWPATSHNRGNTDCLYKDSYTE